MSVGQLICLNLMLMTLICSHFFFETIMILMQYDQSFADHKTNLLYLLQFNCNSLSTSLLEPCLTNGIGYWFFGRFKTIVLLI